MTDFLTTDAEITLTWTPILIGLAGAIAGYGLLREGQRSKVDPLLGIGIGVLIVGIFLTLTGVSVSIA